jgi:hypothetical protein
MTPGVHMAGREIMIRRVLPLIVLACCMTGCATFTERQDKAIRDALTDIRIDVDFHKEPFANVIAYINNVIQERWTSTELERPIISVLTQYRPIRVGVSTQGLESEVESLITDFRARYEQELDKMPTIG